MITRAELHVGVDPGHGGFDFDYRIERSQAGFRLSASLRHGWPRPGALDHRAAQLREEPVRDSAEVEAFLRMLLERYAVFELTDRETEQVMLHPTFHSFRFGNAEGRMHEFRYRIECGKHLEGVHAELVREFEALFDKPGLVERFYALEQGDSEHRAPRPWWKFW